MCEDVYVGKEGSDSNMIESRHTEVIFSRTCRCKKQRTIHSRYRWNGGTRSCKDLKVEVICSVLI